MTEADPEPPRELQSIVGECIESYAERGEHALDDACARWPEHANVLRRRVQKLVDAGLLKTAAEEAALQVAERFGEFRLIEKLGQGGMGTVYLAEQTSLGRTVALKLIRPERLGVGNARARFEREVAALSKLQHDGVATIHAFGEAEGVPWYAMQLVPGIDLARLLHLVRDRELRDLDGSKAREQIRSTSDSSISTTGSREAIFGGSWTEFCVRVGLRLARTLAAVHSHGIVHRDIKPSNVMIDTSGHLTVLDFGLARSIEGEDLTHSGAELGSLPYMSPEQLRGSREEVGPRSDVFGLGATLFHLLALEAPFGSRDAHEIRERILAGRPHDLETLNPDVPKDVETIVLKAIAPEPSQRYASANALGDDLERFLSFEPIRARPASAALRLRRWCRRHPGKATALVAAIVGFVVVPSGLAIQQSIHAREIKTAYDESEEHRKSYEFALKSSLDVLQETARRLVDHEAMQRVGELDPLRRETLERMVRFYEELYERDSGHEAVRREVASAQASLAVILLELGRAAEAVVACQRGAEVIRAASRVDQIESDRDLTILSLLEYRLGVARDRMGDFDAAAEAFRRSLASMDKIRSANDDILRRRVFCRAGIGNGLLARRKNNEALAEIAQTITALERFAETPGNEHVHEDRSLLARQLSNQADAFRRVGNVEASEQSAARAFEFCERLLGDKPGEARVVAIRASTHDTLGALYCDLVQDLRKALPSYRSSLDDFGSLRRRYPKRSAFALGEARAQLGLARVLRARNRIAKALEFVTSAESTLQAISDRDGETLLRLTRAEARLLHADLLSRDPATISDARTRIDKLCSDLDKHEFVGEEATVTALAHSVRVYVCYQQQDFDAALDAAKRSIGLWRERCAESEQRRVDLREALGRGVLVAIQLDDSTFVTACLRESIRDCGAGKVLLDRYRAWLAARKPSAITEFDALIAKRDKEREAERK